MNTHYFTVTPGENQSNAIIGAVWTLVHWHLSHSQIASIGTSFPNLANNNARYINVIRFHGDESELMTLHNALMQSQLMLKGKQIAITPVLPTPDVVRHVITHRCQKFNGRARVMREAKLSKEQATEQLGSRRLPVSVGLFSRSTGQTFHLTPIQTEVDHEIAGTYNTYGLAQNKSATVPIF